MPNFNKLNKKAQFGDFLGWVSVTIIIFFIMFLFGALILLLNFQINKEDIKISEINNNLDYEKTISLINFYQTHYKSFSDWADDPNFLTGFDLDRVSRENQLLGDYPITQEQIDKLIQEKDVLNGFYDAYFKKLNIANAQVYIYTGKDSDKKRLLTSYDYGNYISNPQKLMEDNEIFFPADRENLKAEFFILSKNGNVVGVKYYEK
ncbi:hypothetical protein J4205_00150 [Candidatus Pacearchaeota archaeon]|nr:hypothetical protein [Candidatus Pacearchaeota archaeon]